MAPSMKKCKECGKLFVPKGRENYCSDIHYRPCPVCGKPVEVKYFSDPPRKCDDCKYRKVKPVPAAMQTTKSKSLFNIIPEEGQPSGLAQLKAEIEYTNKIEGSPDNSWMELVEAKSHQTVDPTKFCEEFSGSILAYIGTECKNSFIPGHEYLLKVEKGEYVYNVSSKDDITSGDSCDIVRPFASQISFHQNFAKLKEKTKKSAGKGHTEV